MEEKYHHEASNHSIYSILFETSFCHDSSSESSPIMPDTFREHLTKILEHSFIQNLQTIQISWSMLVLIFFSSPHSFSIGFRSGNLFSVALFYVCLWIIVLLEDPTLAHSMISSMHGQFLIVYLLVFDRIHDATYLNKISRILAEKWGHSIEDAAVYFIVHTGYLCAPKPYWVLAVKNFFCFIWL